MKAKRENWNHREEANKCVSVYWKHEFIERLDAIAEANGLRRNELIKTATLKEVERLERLAGKS